MELTASYSLCPSNFIISNNLTKITLPPSLATRKQQTQSRLPSVTIVSQSNASQVKERRSANYHPSIWEPELIESLNSSYSYEIHGTRLEELKQKAKCLLVSTEDPCLKLKLIDSMQRLGVAYHFEEEIKLAISTLTELDVTSDLYTTSLHFRLLREHGFSASSDVFDKFRGGDGKFMESLSNDIAGLLSLYEASYHGMKGETVLEEAKNFSRKNLKSLLLMENLINEDVVAEQVQQSLEIPLHWRMPRIEARNFIHVHSRDDTSSSVLLELAKLDYNMVQSTYQTELKELTRWWTDLGFKKKLSFSRDRLMENYLWAMGIIFEPQFSKCRIGLTKFVCILTAIDDMYDVYGSLDELELFTTAVNRWDTKAINELPEYMKICYMAMFNFANGVAYDVMNDHGFDILSYLVEGWSNLCGSYLVEARWFANKYTPTLDEYIENARISVGGPAAILHAYILQERNITKTSLSNYLSHGRELIYWSSIITRLSDDLGTHEAESIRGDVTKSIRCYMTETGVSEEEAEDHVKGLISYSWKKLNKESANSSLPKSLVNMCLNMARTAQCIFQHGDGIGTSIGVTKDRLTSLIVEPIPIQSPNQLV